MKVLTDSGLGHLIEKLKSLLPKAVSVEAPGLMPQLSGNEDDVMLGNGTWGEYHGGGGASGPVWLEVDEAGDLYAYYDDVTSPPNLEYDEETGNLYALFETEAA